MIVSPEILGVLKIVEMGGDPRAKPAWRAAKKKELVVFIAEEWRLTSEGVRTLEEERYTGEKKIHPSYKPAVVSLRIGALDFASKPSIFGPTSSPDSVNPHTAEVAP